jgi:uncharacterized repeat protein (TIGR04076 family)
MAKGHFVSKPGKDFDWKGFQKHVGYTDAEMKAMMKDPRKMDHIQKICSADVQDRYLIAEIVESHGCEAGMQVGDRLYFRGMSLLDGELSDPWCPYIVNTYWFTSGMRNMVKFGLDPNSMYVTYSGCMDVGPEHGIGRVVYKIYSLDAREVEEERVKRREKLVKAAEARAKAKAKK